MMTNVEQCSIERIKNEISKLENDIIAWRATLDEESVWLFLGTLGSWSVTIGWLRNIAFIITLILFVWRLQKKAKNKMPFLKVVTNLEQSIHEINDEDKRKALLYDLDVLKKKHLRFTVIVKNYVYIVCLAFWAVSFYIAE